MINRAETDLASITVGYEFDFLPVGNAGPGGDAIVMRFVDMKTGNREDQFVALVDAGVDST